MNSRNRRRRSPSNAPADPRGSDTLQVDTMPSPVFVVDGHGTGARRPMMSIMMDVHSQAVVGWHVS